MLSAVCYPDAFLSDTLPGVRRQMRVETIITERFCPRSVPCRNWGLRLGGTETRKKNQDKWAIEEVKGFSAIDFRGFGEDEQTSTFLFLPAFVPAFSDQQASQKPLFCFSCF